MALFIGIAALSWFVLLNPGVDFTAVDFHTEYKDWKAANERYVGKSLSIRGQVLSIHDGGGMIAPHGWTTVTIGEGPAAVICLFPTEVVYQTKCLTLRQEIVIRGVCKGEFAGLPILSECNLEGMDLPQTVANLWAGMN